MVGSVLWVPGRPAVEDAQPGVVEALEALVAPEIRGDPMSPLRWTTKSLNHLVRGLYAAGFMVGKTTVARLLNRPGTGCRPRSRPSKTRSIRTGTPRSGTSTPWPACSWLPMIRSESTRRAPTLSSWSLRREVLSTAAAYSCVLAWATWRTMA